jgi:hypothetical protein
VWDENHRNGLTADAEVLVRRDRNHPSVVIWSICNEVLCDAGDGVTGPVSIAAAQAIRDVFEAWDPAGPKRVVSANQNSWGEKRDPPPCSRSPVSFPCFFNLSLFVLFFCFFISLQTHFSFGAVYPCPVPTVHNGSVLELLGYDYATSSYDSYHARTPSYPAISSETSSAVSDRGEYSNDEAAGHVTG